MAASTLELKGQWSSPVQWSSRLITNSQSVSESQQTRDVGMGMTHPLTLTNVTLKTPKYRRVLIGPSKPAKPKI